MKLRKSVPVWILALSVSGCASMNKSECLVSDWQTIGYEDGAQGYGIDRLSMRRKACAKHAIAPDLEAYQNGRAQGLREFCRPAKGFSLGERGKGYAGVCPAELEGDFLAAYNSGRHLRQLRVGVTDANKQINQRRSELEDLDDALGATEAALIAKATTTRERVSLLLEMKDLAGRRGELERELEHLIVVREEREDDLYDYTAELGGD